MAHMVTEEMIDQAAVLAKLELSGQERQAARLDLAKMLDYVDKINELDASGAEPMVQICPNTNVFREDVVTNGNGREMTLANAPEKKDGCFVVPKTF